MNTPSVNYGLENKSFPKTYSSVPVGSVFYNIGLRNFTIINSVILVLFAVIYLMVYFFHTSKNWVDINNCVAPIGEFTVEPGVSVSEPLTLCPESTFDNTDKCIFGGVDSLLSATRICNARADICSRFVYNTDTRRMTIVSLQSSPSNSTSQTDNLYTRQTNVTFRTGGVSPSENPIPVPEDIPPVEETTSDPTTNVVSVLGLS